MSHYCCKKCGQRYDYCTCWEEQQEATRKALKEQEAETVESLKEKIKELEAEVSRLVSSAGWEYERQRQTWESTRNYDWK